VLLPDKSLSEKIFQAYKLVCGDSTFAETTLCGSNNFVSFQVPDKSIIDHTFHNLPNTAGESNGAIVCRVRCVFIVVLLLGPHMTDAN